MNGFIWEKSLGIGLTERWKLISDSGEVLCVINHYDDWQVFHRGASRGEFTTIEAAKARAEDVASQEHKR